MVQQPRRRRSTTKRWIRFILPLVAIVLLVGLAVIELWPDATACAPPVMEETLGMANSNWPKSQQAASGSQQPLFDPGRIAYLEKAGWEAYYDRDWPRVFGLMVQMNREQFCMPLPAAVAGAIDIVRASIAFAAVDNDVPVATAHLQDFYEKARRTRDLHADAQTLAALEMDYWTVHRRLAVERKQAPNHKGDIEPMVQALAKLHAALFDASPVAIRRSAELRAEAAKTVDRITGGYSTDIDGDWRQVEEYLSKAYGSLR
jgi:hypothetical protein